MANNDARIPKIKRFARSWSWPVAKPEVTSRFGHRFERNHEGIDLRAAVGTPVYAAHPGEILYAGDRITGYGNMVVVRDPSNQLATVYAHASQILVREGSKVKQGQRIALSGNTGHSSGPHLHFEVRAGSTPLDPLAVMPLLHSIPEQRPLLTGRGLASTRPQPKRHLRKKKMAQRTFHERKRKPTEVARSIADSRTST